MTHDICRNAMENTSQLSTIAPNAHSLFLSRAAKRGAEPGRDHKLILSRFQKCASAATISCEESAIHIEVDV